MVSNWSAWLNIGVVLFIVELVTPSTFFFLCIGIGAVLAALTSVVANQLVAWIVFFVSSILFLILSRPIVRKMSDKTVSRAANVDEFVGKTAMVKETIDTKNHKGMVKAGSEVWLARSEDIIEAGKEVVVIKVDGNYLVVGSKNS